MATADLARRRKWGSETGDVNPVGGSDRVSVRSKPKGIYTGRNRLRTGIPRRLWADHRYAETDLLTPVLGKRHLSSPIPPAAPRGRFIGTRSVSAASRKMKMRREEEEVGIPTSVILE